MKTISVVLTRYTDPFSSFFYILMGGGYTHASISLDEDGETMYSFDLRGFCEESIAKHRRRGVTKSVRYTLQVSDRAYARLRQKLDFFIRNREQYRYTKLGVAFCFAHIPMRLEKRYFCSQFVAQMLTDTGAVRLRRHPALYKPNHFCRDLLLSPQLQRIVYNPV